MLDTEAELMAPHPTKKSPTSAYLLSELHRKTSDMGENNGTDIYIESENVLHKVKFSVVVKALC
jgi:hypothetical protein